MTEIVKVRSVMFGIKNDLVYPECPYAEPSARTPINPAHIYCIHPKSQHIFCSNNHHIGLEHTCPFDIKKELRS